LKTKQEKVSTVIQDNEVGREKEKERKGLGYMNFSFFNKSFYFRV
jgi:hypothetical protein